MTSIQIEYWKNMENKRHNFQMEKLTGEAQAEVARHNVQAERIGYAQASASYMQAQAAQRNAEINYRLSQLQELKYQYERQIAYHQMSLMDAQARNQNSQSGYNMARTAQQELETGVYSMYGAMQSAAQLSLTTQDYYRSSAQTDLYRAEAATEPYKRVQYVFNSANQGVSAFKSLFGDKTNSKGILSLFKK